MSKKNTKNDYILMAAAVLLLILSAGAIFWSSNVNNNNASRVLPPKIIGQAALTVDFGDGKERNFEGEIIEGETLLDALSQASKAGNFSYKLDEKNNLAAIDNFTRSKNKSWYWYLNDKKIDKLLGEIILKSGDEILLQYK